MTMSLATDGSMPGLHDEYNLDSSVYSTSTRIVDSGVKSLAHHPSRNRKRIFCPYCGNGYSRKEHLERHIPSHTGLNPHRCRECFLSYPRKDLLSRHQQQHHSQVANSPKEMTDNTQKPDGQTISCKACSKAKTKCDRALPSCGRCRDRNQPCIPRESKRGIKKECARRNLRNAQTTVATSYWPPVERGMHFQYALPDLQTGTSDIAGSSYAHHQIPETSVSPSVSHAHHHQSPGMHASSSAYFPQQAMQASVASTPSFTNCVPEAIHGNFLSDQETYETSNYDNTHVDHQGGFVGKQSTTDYFPTTDGIRSYQILNKLHDAGFAANQTWEKDDSLVPLPVSQPLTGGNIYQSTTMGRPFWRGHNSRPSFASSVDMMDDQIMETIEHQSPMHQSVRSNSIFSSNGSTQVKTTETTPEPLASAQETTGEGKFVQHPLSQFNSGHQETCREMLPPPTPENGIGHDMYQVFDGLEGGEMALGLTETWNLEDMDANMSMLSSTADLFDYGGVSLSL